MVEAGLVELRQRQGRDHWKKSTRGERSARPAPQIPSSCEEQGVSPLQLGVQLFMTGDAALEHASGPPAVPLHDDLDIHTLPAALRKRHPEIPVLVSVTELPTAHPEQCVSSYHRRRRQDVQMRNLPRVEPSPHAQAKLDVAPDLGIPPSKHGGGTCVEGVGERCDRPGDEDIVGIQRENVRSARRRDTGHARRGESAVCLRDDVHALRSQLFEDLQRFGIRRTVVNDDELDGLLVVCRGDRFTERRAVVEARNHDRHARSLCRDLTHGFRLTAEYACFVGNRLKRTAVRLALGVAHTRPGRRVVQLGMRTLLKLTVDMAPNARLGRVREWPASLRGFEDLAFLFTSTQLDNGIAQLTIAEAALLFRMARDAGPGTLVEIGRYKGGSTLVLAAAMHPEAHLVSYDLHAVPGAPSAEFDRELSLVLERYGLAGRVDLVVADSTSSDPRDDCILVFVDGDHSYEGVLADYEHWARAIIPGGHLLFHDAPNRAKLAEGGCEPVARALLEIERRAGASLSRVGQADSVVAFVRTEAPVGTQARTSA